MTPKRVLITGSSGYYGRAVVRAMRAEWPYAEIMGLDMVEPASDLPHRFEKCDITGTAIAGLVASFQPDLVLHLAFVVNPMRDEARMHQINVEGTQNLLAALDKHPPAQLLIASSATAYGAWPDNPVPMTEEQPLRSRRNFRYAADKVQVEEIVAEFAAKHPQIIVCQTRPCIIYGPGMSNFMIPLFTALPVMALPGGDNSTIQFVHLDDVVRATMAILKTGSRGAFNVAPPDWQTVRELGKYSGRFAIPVPYVVLQAITTVWWGLRLPIFLFPATLWPFIRFPWVITPERLTKELNFSFQHSSLDVMKQLLKNAGKLKQV
jgi:UDP-glucose 4-epimerase